MFGKFKWAFVGFLLILAFSAVQVTHGAEPGTFTSGTFTNSSGSRPYKLYIPTGYIGGQPTPLLVALHGCTQNPDNFAAGTRFNLLADQNTFIVLYPQQTSANNSLSCWNWFDTAHQSRGQGEPGIIVGMVNMVKSNYTVDNNRVYLTGMSAGGAMSSIMGACYPDVFAAIGVHSGLEYKGATSSSNASSAQLNGGPDPNTTGQQAYQCAGAAARVLPVIVFQGDQDWTVRPVNASQVISSFAQANDYADDGLNNNTITDAVSSTQNGQVNGGYSYTVTTTNYNGQSLLQKYLVAGMAHAWSGGSTTSPATYTDAKGPDASTLMWNFFAAHPKAGTPVPTNTAAPTFIPATNTPGGPISTATNTPIPPTVTPVPTTQPQTITLDSIGSQDGYVMSNFAYTYDLSVGSSAGAKQYGFTSFVTSGIPAGATIDSVTLSMVRNYASFNNPWSSLGAALVDINGGNGFGNSTTLQGSDGAAAADAVAVCSFSSTNSALQTSSCDVSPTAFQYINRTGTTQFRLYFANNSGSAYVGFYGGENMTVALRPKLVVTYH